MSSKTAPDHPSPARAWSLAARLTAWYAGSAFLLVLVATVYLYWAMVGNVDWEDDELLADRVRVAQADLRRTPGDPAAAVRDADDDARRHERTYVRVLDPDGRAVAESPGLAEVLPGPAFPEPTAGPGRGTNVRAGGREFRAVAVREPGSSWTVQAAMDRSLEVEMLANFRRHLWPVLGIALLACTAAGYLIARRGVRPVHAIADTARRIHAGTLGERIDPTGLPAELLALAGTFNLMLDRLEGSFARLARFSADIAHELRTPVHALRGEAEVALSRPRTPDEYREALSSCLEACGRLSRLIDRLLFLARSEHPETLVVREAFEAGAELAAVCEFHEPAATEAGVKLVVVAGEPVAADLDRPLFQRAVGNLIANAVAHTPAGGAVTLTAEADTAGLRVRVADTGCGIPADHLPHVFDRFYRADRSRPSGSGNVGLGLAIVKTIVELHGGSVEVVSRAGRGTTVTLLFPRRRESR